MRAFVESASLLEGICAALPCTFVRNEESMTVRVRLTRAEAREPMAAALYRQPQRWWLS